MGEQAAGVLFWFFRLTTTTEGKVMSKWISQLFCRHEYVEMNSLGTSSAWKCSKCGKRQTRELADFY